MKSLVQYSWVSAATLTEMIEETCKYIEKGWTPKDTIVLKQMLTIDTINQGANSYNQKLMRVVLDDGEDEAIGT